MSLDVQTAILQRRSIRRFSPRPIDDAVLLELVELARLYASGGNIQPVRFSILSAPPYKDQLFHLLHWAAYIPGFSISAEERPPHISSFYGTQKSAMAVRLRLVQQPQRLCLPPKSMDSPPVVSAIFPQKAFQSFYQFRQNMRLNLSLQSDTLRRQAQL